MHYVLDKLLCWFCVYLVDEKLFNHTHVISYFTNIDSVFCMILPVKKSNTVC